MSDVPIDHADLLARWDDLSKSELWALDSGDLHNIIDVAKAEIERLRTDLATAGLLVARLVAQRDALQARLDAAEEECQRHQVGKSYEVGHEHGSAVAVKYKNERDEYKARLDAVRALHAPDVGRCGYCSSLTDVLGDIWYPCPTVAAIEGTVT